MKSYLLSIVLLLVPLAIADEQVPLAKFIYDQGYVIADTLNETIDEQGIEYTIENDTFKFDTQDTHADSSYLRLDGNNLLGQIHSFTVELIGRKSENWPNNICELKSDKKFRDSITWCIGKAIIREPTPEELAQVQQYREKQKETKKPFQVTYDRGQMRTQSVGLTFFYSNVFPQGGTKKFYSISNDHSGKRGTYMYFNDGSLETRSFIVEGLAEDTSATDCTRTEHPVLKPVECRGPVRLGNLAN